MKASSFASGPASSIITLDRLTSTLSGAGKGAEHFDRAIQTLSGQLSAAGAANASAQEKLSAGKSRYGELETALNRTAKAAERAAEKLCFFLVRNTDRFESHVDVLKYATDEGSTGNGVETIWWWHKTVTAELNLRGQE